MHARAAPPLRSSATTALLLLLLAAAAPWRMLPCGRTTRTAVTAATTAVATPAPPGGKPVLRITGSDLFDRIMPSDEFWVIAVGSSLDGTNRTAQRALESAVEDLAALHPSLPFRLAIADADEYVEGTDGDDLLFREQHAKALASGTPALLLYQFGLKGLGSELPLGPSAIKRLVREAKQKAKKKTKSKKKRRKYVRKHMRRELLDMLGTFFPSKVVDVHGIGRLRKSKSWAKRRKKSRPKSGRPNGAPTLSGPVSLATLIDAYGDSPLDEDRVMLLLEAAEVPGAMQHQNAGSASVGPPTWLRRLSLLHEHRGAIFTRSTDATVHRRFLGASGSDELPAVFVLSEKKRKAKAVDLEGDSTTIAGGDGLLTDGAGAFDLERRAVRVKILAEYGGVQNVWWDRIAPRPGAHAYRLAEASAHFVQSVLEGPRGWVPVPRI